QQTLHHTTRPHHATFIKRAAIAAFPACISTLRTHSYSHSFQEEPCPKKLSSSRELPAGSAVLLRVYSDARAPAWASSPEAKRPSMTPGARSRGPEAKPLCSPPMSRTPRVSKPPLRRSKKNSDPSMFG